MKSTFYLTFGNNADDNPIFANRYLPLVARQPKPYLTERWKLIEDASGKYFVGQETSPI
jgi:hypothetical protein